MHAPERKSVRLGEGQVSYLEWKNEGAALHFAHATGFNCETYRSLLHPLATHHQIFASDLRGHGFTILPAEGTADWALYATDLMAWIDIIHPAPLVLAGHSMGAIISMMVAARYPDRIRALVLVEPVFPPLMAGQPPARLKDSTAVTPEPERATRAQRRRSLFASVEEAFNSYRGRGAFKSWPDEVLRDYLQGGLVPSGSDGRMTLACTPAWEARTFQATLPGAARIAQSIKCPMSIIVGEEGTTADAEELEALTRLSPSARIERVQGATHFLPMERPDIVRDEIARVLRSL